MGVPGSADLMLIGRQGYRISRSLRFNSADSAYLNRTPAGSGTGAGRTWTWSGWVKRSKSTPSDLQLLLSASSSRSGFGFFTYSGGGTGSDSFSVYHGASFATRVETTQVFRDFSSWYHIIVSVDTTQATAANRIRIYVNGSEVTQFSTASYPAQNYQFGICEATAHNVGRDSGGGAYYFDGYLTECYLIDGQALTPSSFGETDTITGVWKPKRYTGTYGTNGFYLNFSDNSGITATTLGKDYSGNGNNWTPNNFSVTAGAGNDSMIDTPTPYADGGNGRGNYCTWNPLSLIGFLLANGNLEVQGSVTSNRICKGTFGMSSGKWYWEITNTTLSASSVTLGICSDSASYSAGVLSSGYDVLYYGNTGNKYINGSSSAYGAAYTVNDVIGIALDADARTITFYKNNISQGTISSLQSGITWVPCWLGQGNTADYSVANFGQRAFAYTPPSGFLALNTQNLPDPTIKKPSTYMDVVTYIGNGTTQTISGLGFSPDLVWIKRRNVAATHVIYDTSRTLGVSLSSDSTSAEPSTAVNGTLSAFNSNGFNVAVVSGYNYTNGLSDTYVAWCWDAGTAATNTAGTITSTVSANASAGFSIVSYTGTISGSAPTPLPTVGHGLGVAPQLVIGKSRNNDGIESGNWFVWHAAAGTGNWLRLNTTDAAGSISGSGGGTMVAPTSAVFSTPYISGSNISGATYVAYCFSEVAGFSKFGSYTGNGSSDGPFVYLGFRPRWVMIKRTDSTSGWHIYDTVRGTANVVTTVLAANLLDAESSFASGYDIDLVSNGFKPRTGPSIAINTSGATYIFAAFAEAPFKYSLAR